MADQEAVRAARQGTKLFRRWLEGSGYPAIDLSGADLAKCDLRWVNFAGANLEGANFREAQLTGSYFGPSRFQKHSPFVTADDNPATVSDVCFDNSLLLAATFNYPRIENASFVGAYLGLTNFRQVTFKNNTFEAARLVNTAFSGCDMSGISNLESVYHYGPSHLDPETLFRSSTLSKKFLLRTGIPEALAEYLPNWVASMEPIGFYSCFLSHSSDDQAFCDRLYERMVNEGLRVWYAPENMRGGEQIVPQITDAIKAYDKVIVVLSEASMRSSWVNNEIRWAQRREQSSGAQSFFPLSIVPFSQIAAWELIDSDTGVDVAAHIRSYFISDFSRWRDEAFFEEAFRRLLNDLKSQSDG